MPVIAIIGAGPGLGLALARTFGAHGYAAALISRSATNLEPLVTQLSAEGIHAEAFTADVLDRQALTAALSEAASRLGGIEVLEYSPVDKAPGAITMTSPSQTQPEDVQAQLESQLFGAMAAAQAVIPAMREAGAGTLLFTTGAGSIKPEIVIANVNAAAAALRNWAINLHQELADTGIYAAHVGIDVSIDTAMMPGFPVAPAAEVAAAYWDLHTRREGAEFVFTRS